MSNKDNVYKDYDDIADWFDKHRSRELFEKYYLDMAIAHLNSHSKILDLGCGMGAPIAEYFIGQGFNVIGVDGSQNLIKFAKERFPKTRFLCMDMRGLDLDEEFDCILAWHSLFHLTHEEQRKMFQTFERHANPGAILMFTSGPEAGEVWSNNGGVNLYHASLSMTEYKDLLKKHHFEVIAHNIEDEDCGGATVWVAKYQSFPTDKTSIVY